MRYIHQVTGCDERTYGRRHILFALVASKGRIRTNRTDFEKQQQQVRRLLMKVARWGSSILVPALVG